MGTWSDVLKYMVGMGYDEVERNIEARFIGERRAVRIHIIWLSRYVFHNRISSAFQFD